MRKLCKKCQKRPVAINYYKNGKTFYRSTCDHCAKDRKEGMPLWALKGYRKKNVCDKCGTKSPYPEVFNVYHADGDLTNCRDSNLKTICANCQRIIHKDNSKWRKSNLKADF
jgi:protein-arginine kinase activator protein McsA